MLGRSISVLVVLAVSFGAFAFAQEQPPREYANVREGGRAAIEYEDDEMHVVAAYYFSQRNHESRWVLLEVALSADRGMTIHRDDISLITPEGRELPVASQRRWSQDLPRVRTLLQRATTTRHGIGSYFPIRRFENIGLFALPFGGLAHDDFAIDQWRVAWGDLFFESPTGLWEPGTYTLVVQGDDTRAMLPIDLE